MPAASRATAVRVWKPLIAVVVSQEIEYGALVCGTPRLTPSSLNWTAATTKEPALLTFAPTATIPVTVDPEAGEAMVTTELPSGGGGGCSCALAWGGMPAKLQITIRVAA